MLNIHIDGLDRVQQRLDALAGGPAMQRALADGINRTMSAIEQAELNALERDLDQPTPFTMNALRVLPAKPKTGRLNAILFVQPIQAKYLQTAVKGGTIKTLTPNLGPGGPKLSAYGNILGKRKGLAGIRDRTKGISTTSFIGTHPVSGVFGLWQRAGKGRLRMLVKLEDNAPRDKRLDFYGIGQRTAEQRLRADVAEAIALALRSR